MGMGIVTDDDFKSEVNNSLVKTNIKKSISSVAEIIDMPALGRGKGNVEVPDSIRKIIGETSATEGRASALDLASRLGISKSSVSAYTEGATSTATISDTPNKEHIDNAKERVAKRARNKLMTALGALTPAKIQESKGIEIAGIARQMSAIVKDMEPETPTRGINNGIQFVLYAPQVKSESSFETIYAKE